MHKGSKELRKARGNAVTRKEGQAREKTTDEGVKGEVEELKKL